MCSTDYDPCHFWRDTWPKARKQHVCAECHRLIPIGASYRRVFFIYEPGDPPESLSIHSECETLRAFIEKEVCGGEGDILVPGMAEEVGNLNEYSIRIDGEEDELRALGFDPEDDVGVREVVRWVWDLAVDHYPRPPKLEPSDSSAT